MPQKVLIVDDSLQLHALTRACLEEQSLLVHSAYSGTSALALVASVKPDLVLLDIDIPDMNGFEVCRVLKMDAETLKIPIIFLTACVSMDEKLCGFNLQAVDYITKPFDPAELCARVRVALRTKRLLDLLPTPLAIDQEPGGV